MPDTISPEEDGVTHVNIYSKSRTRLGRLLSNLAYAPFYHPKQGRFSSMEAYFYWLSTGMQHDYLKDLYGYKAKQEGKKHAVVKHPKFQENLRVAVKLKLIQNKEIIELLSENTLPFKHYYVYGDTHVVDRTESIQWMIEAIKETLSLIDSLL